MYVDVYCVYVIVYISLYVSICLWGCVCVMAQLWSEGEGVGILLPSAAQRRRRVAAQRRGVTQRVGM